MSNSLKITDTALESVGKHEQLMKQECFTILNSFSAICKDLGHDWETVLLDKASCVISLCKAREALRATISRIRESQQIEHPCVKGDTYQISSLFLKESWDYLVSAPSRGERLHLVTGTVTQEGTRVLSKMQKLKLTDQSPVYVKADDRDAHQTIICLEEDFGHLVLGMFHSHMSKGAGSTSPSSIDTAFLQRMEKLGCNCLGGIFSLDGFVRFYARQDFELQLYGKGLVKIHDKPNDKLFQISRRGDLK
jgi:hypothetical protein